MDAVTAAFSRLFDYAGLFPPASLPLDGVVERYGRYRSGSHAWMLGRLIVPAERLAEAEASARRAGAAPEDAWRVSALVGPVDRHPALAAAIEGLRGSALTVESIEATATTEEEIAAIAATWPMAIERFVEIPSAGDPSPLLRGLGARGLMAKLRAGGVTADRIPGAADVARFLARAREAGVALKATAGLHHAIRGDYRLTDEPDAAAGTMHGFVNLLVAATLLSAGTIDEELAEACLDDDRPGVFKLSGRAGSWLNGVMTYSEIAHARRALVRSIGTCSFEEPAAEIDALDFGLKGVDQV